MRDDAAHVTFYALYLHTKGVTRPGDIFVRSWVDYMLYFNMKPLCIQLLASYDAVGVNLQAEPALHYSGNFWWATSSYMRTLAPCARAHYNSPEFWLTETNAGKYASLWQSGRSHYGETYPAWEYAERPIVLYTHVGHTSSLTNT
jgi:hypothetical protein